MEPNQRRVLDFHRAFRLPAPERFTALRDPELLKLRARLILEEALEFCSAAGVTVSVNDRPVCSDEDISFTVHERLVDDVKMIDAIADLKYVADGAAICMGIDMEHFDIEVHRSNMSKSAVKDGKAQKGKLYRPPNIEGILFERYLRR